MDTPTLELTFTDGEVAIVKVTSYNLTLGIGLHQSPTGYYKLGAFKINSAAYKKWKPVEKIKFLNGECKVLSEHPPATTPRTVTYKIRLDFSDY